MRAPLVQERVKGLWVGGREDWEQDDLAVL